MAVTWQMLNVAEFEAGLARISADMTVVTEAATLEAGEVLKRTAQEIAPRESGALASSIGVFPGPDRSVLVGPTVPYGRRVELGYRRRSGRGRQSSRPEPYLRPGLASTVDRIRQTYSAAWRRGLGKG